LTGIKYFFTSTAIIFADGMAKEHPKKSNDFLGKGVWP